MALFPFLAHTVQHFFRLSARLFVHAGLGDLFLEFSYIRNILRVHVIELFLQIVDLFSERCLTVELLLAVLLGFLGLGGDFCHLHELVDRFFNKGISCFYGILGKDGVLFINTQVQIFGQRRDKVINALALKDEASRPDPPLVILDKPEKGSPDIGEYFLLLFFGQVPDRRPDRKCGAHFAVFNDRADDLHSVDRADLDHILIAYGLHSGGEPDRIEIFCLQAVFFCFGPEKREQDLCTGF